MLKQTKNPAGAYQICQKYFETSLTDWLTICLLNYKESIASVTVMNLYFLAEIPDFRFPEFKLFATLSDCASVYVRASDVNY